jgi:hypothetical protein
MKNTERTRDVLVAVDVQNDFISGSLAVNEGEQVVEPLNDVAAAVRQSGGDVVSHATGTHATPCTSTTGLRTASGTPKVPPSTLILSSSRTTSLSARVQADFSMATPAGRAHRATAGTSKASSCRKRLLKRSGYSLAASRPTIASKRPRWMRPIGSMTTAASNSTCFVTPSAPSTYRPPTAKKR